MGLMDRVIEQAKVIGRQARTAAAEAAQEGKVRLDQAQAKRRADAMFRELGAAVYAQRTDRASADTPDKIERLVKALSEQEAGQGLGDSPGPGDPGTPPPSAP